VQRAEHGPFLRHFLRPEQQMYRNAVSSMRTAGEWLTGDGINKVYGERDVGDGACWLDQGFLAREAARQAAIWSRNSSGSHACRPCLLVVSRRAIVKV
jgi:hypothetical protein